MADSRKRIVIEADASQAINSVREFGRESTRTIEDIVKMNEKYFDLLDRQNELLNKVIDSERNRNRETENYNRIISGGGSGGSGGGFGGGFMRSGMGAMQTFGSALGFGAFFSLTGAITALVTEGIAYAKTMKDLDAVSRGVSDKLHRMGEHIGMTDIQLADFVKSFMMTTGDTRGAVGRSVRLGEYEKAFGVDRGQLLQFAGLERMTGGRYENDFARLLKSLDNSGVIDIRGKSFALLSEKLDYFTKVMNMQGQRMDAPNGAVTAGVLGAFNMVGGAFSDQRQLETMGKLDQMISNPSNDFRRAFIMQAMTRNLNNQGKSSDYVSMMEQMESGLFGQGNLRSVLDLAKEQFGGFNTTEGRIGLQSLTGLSYQQSGRLANVLSDTDKANKFYDAIDKYTQSEEGSSDRADLEKQVQEEFGINIKKLAEQNTSFTEQIVASIRDTFGKSGQEFIQGLAQVLTVEDLQAFGNAIEKFIKEGVDVFVDSVKTIEAIVNRISDMLGIGIIDGDKKLNSSKFLNNNNLFGLAFGELPDAISNGDTKRSLQTLLRIGSPLYNFGYGIMDDSNYDIIDKQHHPNKNDARFKIPKGSDKELLDKEALEIFNKKQGEGSGMSSKDMKESSDKISRGSDKFEDTINKEWANKITPDFKTSSGVMMNSALAFDAVIKNIPYYLGTMIGAPSPVGSNNSGSSKEYNGKIVSDSDKLNKNKLTERTQNARDNIVSTFGVTDIGGFGYRKGATDHDDGKALDVMLGKDYMSEEAINKGNEIADYHIKNAEKLGVKYVIWRQRIASKKNDWAWRQMEDRGDDTSNHFDHVHLSFYERGGHTGNMPRGDIAGFVHGDEFVFDADTTKQFRGLFEAIHSGRLRGYASGGAVKSGTNTNYRGKAKGFNSNVNFSAAYGLLGDLSGNLSNEQVDLFKNLSNMSDAYGSYMTFQDTHRVEAGMFFDLLTGKGGYRKGSMPTAFDMLQGVEGGVTLPSTFQGFNIHTHDNGSNPSPADMEAAKDNMRNFIVSQEQIAMYDQNGTIRAWDMQGRLISDRIATMVSSMNGLVTQLSGTGYDNRDQKFAEETLAREQSQIFTNYIDYGSLDGVKR